MREMTKEELIMYNILKTNQSARDSNWEAVREFYWQRYLINLPKLENEMNIWTVERMIRTLKSLYKECTDESSDAIKEVEVDKYKEMALDDNKPLKPELQKVEEIKLQGEGIWW